MKWKYFVKNFTKICTVIQTANVQIYVRINYSSETMTQRLRNSPLLTDLL